MISTRDLTLLPDVKFLRAACQSMALLDAIVEQDWNLRYYSFEVNAGPEQNIAIGSMRNAAGDELHAIFGKNGCLIRGFVRSCSMVPTTDEPPKVFPGVLDDVPPEFPDCLAAFHSDRWRDITFCVWRENSAPAWQHGKINFPEGPDPDGSELLFAGYDGKPETYQRWAEEYYRPRPISLEAVRQLFEHHPLTDAVIRVLNPYRTREELEEEMRYIGYGNGD
jgi:hypothetical protein